MKSNKKNIIVLLVLVMGFVFLPNIKLDFGDGQKTNVINPKASGGYSRSFIHVDGNWTQTASEAWCYGDGSWGNPYIIENVTVDCGSTGSGILINNSKNDYFIVRNCTVFNAGSGVYDAGIKLENTNNGTLSINNCSNNRNGIILVNNCKNNTVSENTANNNYYGIYLRDSNNNTISGNTANNNDFAGILLEHSNNNDISGNIMNECGLYIYGSFEVLSSHNIDTSNLVNENPLYYYANETNLGPSNFTNAGQVILVNCNDSLISNLNTSNGTTGISLYYGNNNIISGNTANYNFYGIELWYCDNNTVSGNTANNNDFAGIYLEDSNDNTISGNTANDNGEDGIYLNRSDNNTISGNTANYNEDGIYLYRSDNNTISGNTANYNDDGIYLNHALNNTIKGNKVSNNNYGINIENGCDYNEISETVIYNNTIGIEIDDYGGSSDDNLIYKNFFLINGIHATDNGTDNKWNSTTIGNYWDNHTGPDTTPQDGIVDIPYTFIGGSAGSIDYLPIAEDGAPSITINSPSDDNVSGTNAPNYDVTITDDHLFEMWYTLDGGLHNYTFTEFTGNINQTAWDALSDGTITLTFYASDTPGNIGSADISIVKDTTGPNITINSPSSGSEFGVSAPAFIITITDDHLDSMWYSLDGGLTTHAITTNDTIDQTDWAALSEGPITITFYANDTLGNLLFEELTITKSIPPVVDDSTIVIVIIVVVSIVGGVVVLAAVYLFMKKRATP